MVTITEGVEFDTIAREWRCKWSADSDKKSLQEAQKALEAVLATVKKVSLHTGGHCYSGAVASKEEYAFTCGLTQFLLKHKI